MIILLYFNELIKVKLLLILGLEMVNNKEGIKTTLAIKVPSTPSNKMKKTFYIESITFTNNFNKIVNNNKNYLSD